MSTLRILHLSDLHEELDAHREPARRRRVLGDAWDQNLDDVLARGPVDLVCFTGDLAYSGKEPEYAHVHRWLSRLMARLDLPADRLFLVPGNHDVDRGAEGSPERVAWKTLRALLPRCQPVDVARWLRGGKAPPGLTDAQRDLVLARRGAYDTFVKTTLGRAELLPARSPHGRLGFRTRLNWNGPPVWLVGLDSAWLAGDEHDAGALLLTDAQALSLTTDAEGDPLPGFRLALVHHPLDHLADQAHVRRLLAERVDLLLHGHLHDPEVSAWEDPERRLRFFAAGCLYEHDRFPNAVSRIEVTLDTRGRPTAYDLWFWAFSPRGHWFPDGGLYRAARNGHLHVAG
jgi:3',5'-cyclic AMP phosphodiesterase CpdA